MDLHLKDKKFIVTGGTDGLGFATARGLIEEGARVLVTGRTEEKFKRAREALGERLTFFAGDNADPTFPSRLKDEAVKTWGWIDGLLVSVGGPPGGKALTTTDEMWEEAFAKVFLGTTRLLRELSGIMHDGGSIALVLSTSAKVAISTIPISNGLRPGLAMLVKNYAEELGGRKIRVNALLPGSFATDRMKQLGATDPAKFAALPLQRIGHPAEFGQMATVILSSAASYVTGTTIIIDGGATKAL